MSARYPSWSVLLPVPARWILPTPPPPLLRARLPYLHPVLLQVLFNRGLAEPDAVEGAGCSPVFGYGLRRQAGSSRRLRQDLNEFDRVAQSSPTLR